MCMNYKELITTPQTPTPTAIGIMGLQGFNGIQGIRGMPGPPGPRGEGLREILYIIILLCICNFILFYQNLKELILRGSALY